MGAEPEQQRFPLPALLVISGAIFASVSSEFLPTGLLPDIAAELDVSVSQVGLLVTIFALTVVVSTAPLTALTLRFPRKWLMVAMLGLLVLANLLCAVAPSYWFLAVARVLGGLAHGVFWAVTGPYSTRLVSRRHLSRAVAVTQAGGSAAFVLGVPLGTALGHALGWRLSFAVMAGVVLVFLILVVVALPPVSHLVPLATGEIAIPARHDRTIPALIIVAATALLLNLGQNTFYTYIVPWTTQVGGVAPGDVGGFLFFYGLAGAVGLVIAGVFGDRYPRGAFLVLLSGLVIAVLGLALFAPGTPLRVAIGLVIWSMSFGGLPSLLQSRMMHSVSFRLRDTASAWVTISFNIAIGGGALLGGVLLDTLGIRVLPWAEAALVLAGIAFILATDRRRMSLHPDLHQG
ncbi:MAG TPA: MFS transporter [Pseudolysinimonas sp.]|jgi:predicted MFS family arabinose efflux permease